MTKFFNADIVRQDFTKPTGEAIVLFVFRIPYTDFWRFQSYTGTNEQTETLEGMEEKILMNDTEDKVYEYYEYLLGDLFYEGYRLAGTQAGVLKIVGFEEDRRLLFQMDEKGNICSINGVKPTLETEKLLGKLINVEGQDIFILKEELIAKLEKLRQMDDPTKSEVMFNNIVKGIQNG